ncbi:hypothetical protein D9M68_534530 [compost metagenome]
MYRFGNEVGGRRGAPTEATTEEQGVDFHLLRLEPGDLRADLLIDGLELRTNPDLTFVRADLHRAVERLHRRVGEVGHGVFDVEGLRRLAQRRLAVAALRSHLAGGGGECLELIIESLTVQAGVLPKVPVDFQRIAAELRRPVVVGDYRDATRHLHHLAHAGHGLGRRRIETLDLAAEHRCACHQRGQQAIELHIHAELRTPADLLRRIQALGRFADDLPVLRLLEFQRGRIGRLQLAGRIGQLAVAHTLATGDDFAVLGADGRWFDAKTLCRRLHQHGPCGGAGLPVAVELRPDAGRTTGHLYAEVGVGVRLCGRGMLDPDRRPVGIQLLGDQHRQPGPDTLAHLRVGQQHGDAVVAAHAQEGVGHEARGTCCRRFGQGEALAAGDHKGDHQAAAKQCAVLQETPPRSIDHAAHDKPPSQVWEGD